MQERLARYEAFLSLGFGRTDSAKLLCDTGAKGVGRVCYFMFGHTE